MLCSRTAQPACMPAPATPCFRARRSTVLPIRAWSRWLSRTLFRCETRRRSCQRSRCSPLPACWARLLRAFTWRPASARCFRNCQFTGSTKGAEPNGPCPIEMRDGMPELVVAKPREGKFNKNAARRVRVAGKIPAVLYGAGHDAVAVEVDPKQISRILFSETGHNTIFDVEVAGIPPAKAMIVDWQREPIKDKLIHIDMKRIALDKLLRVSVRVKLLGVPVGVKTEGGILDQVLREVEIECLPTDIPNHIDVDVTH